MSTVIKGGTIVTADLTYKADVKIDGGKIVEIGPSLFGDEVLDATGCYVMPGGIDPHVHLEMPFMGTYSADDFESGTRAALAGGTTMVVDFCLPNPGQSLLEALADVGQQVDPRQVATIPSTWRSPGGASRCSTR
jgi:dihydropyrimidinase